MVEIPSEGLYIHGDHVFHSDTPPEDIVWSKEEAIGFFKSSDYLAENLEEDPARVWHIKKTTDGWIFVANQFAVVTSVKGDLIEVLPVKKISIEVIERKINHIPSAVITLKVSIMSDDGYPIAGLNETNTHVVLSSDAPLRPVITMKEILSSVQLGEYEITFDFGIESIENNSPSIGSVVYVHIYPILEKSDRILANPYRFSFFYE